MSKHYRQVSIEEEGIPKEDGYYFTDRGDIELTIYVDGTHYWRDEESPELPDPTWWLKPIEPTTHVLTEEELETLVVNFARKRDWYLTKGHSTESAWRTYLMEQKDKQDE
jgi:hypothetical protein